MRLPFVSRRAYNLLKNEKKEIDWLMWITGFIGPLSTLPQVYLIYVHENASSISLFSWILYLITGLISLMYSLVHRIKPLAVTNTLWIVVDTFVIIGVFLYGKA